MFDANKADVLLYVLRPSGALKNGLQKFVGEPGHPGDL
jgi:hypothetical protein